MPISNTNPVRSPSNELQHQCIRAVGGAAAVTKVTGPGVDVTRTGTGAYLLTWTEDPGNFLGAGAFLQATTPANLAGHTVICGPYVPATKTMTVNVYNAADAVHDLAALEWFTVLADTSYTNLDL